MEKVIRKKETTKMVLARAKEGLHFTSDSSLKGSVYRRNCFYDGIKLDRLETYYFLDGMDKIARSEFKCPHCNLVYLIPVCNIEQLKFNQLLLRRIKEYGWTCGSEE
jgi:hypothetical protein